MRRTTEDGEHEAWAGVLRDGRATEGSAGDDVLVGQDRVSEREVIVGFRCHCMCGWDGVHRTRVSASEQADAAGRLIYSEHGADVAGRRRANNDPRVATPRPASPGRIGRGRRGTGQRRR